MVRFGRKSYDNPVSRPDDTGANDDGHDSRPTDQLAVRSASERGRHEAVVDRVELSTGISKPGYPDLGLVTKSENGIDRQSEELDPPRGDVLTHRTRFDRHTVGRQLVVQLSVDQVDLSKVGLSRISKDPRAVLHRLSEVRIPLDAETGQ